MPSSLCTDWPYWTNSKFICFQIKGLVWRQQNFQGVDQEARWRGGRGAPWAGWHVASLEVNLNACGIEPNFARKLCKNHYCTSMNIASDKTKTQVHLTTKGLMIWTYISWACSILIWTAVHTNGDSWPWNLITSPNLQQRYPINQF